MNCIIHINGRPGSGRRSIGQIPAALIGGRLLDNHTMLNPAEALHAEVHQAISSQGVAVLKFYLPPSPSSDPRCARATFSRKREKDSALFHRVVTDG